MPSYRQLRRSRTDRMIGGVCAGIARYFNVDPVAVRVAVAVLTIITGGVAAAGYVAAWIFMPAEPFDATGPQNYYPPQQPPTA